ncbi:bacteriohemerythrin [Pseudovibrio sp. SPO723]|uniref:GGDEF domain-containing protein n=1 Tax=Nesiotobacter zosterae TaxID=392721 RepID=UPI0029C3360B|nr:bacteriohemerythrin [Pseudovibrio sp. SPO723]MDX5594248.1 bacteriohemerythrin [Pseudovibrio sp. SPO723]
MQVTDVVVFPWNKNFETGIATVDEQHKQLVNLLNRLASTLVSDDPVGVAVVFNELADYASYHFAEEEEVWETYFDGADDWKNAHLKSHGSFLPSVLQIKEKAADEPWQEVTEKVLRFLIRWLAFHILDEDKKMSFVVQAMDSGLSFSEAKVAADQQMGGSIRVLIETVLNMYDELSLHAIELIRERQRRILIEEELKQLNEKLEKLSITDELTGLYNRRYFNVLISDELRRAAAANKQVAFLSLDLDHFKRVNDTYGHLQGDKVLQDVGTILARHSKTAVGSAFRMGGEELLIVSVGHGQAEAVKLAERVREEVATILIRDEAGGPACRLTTSIGVVARVPASGEGPELFLEQADRALYQAKQEGRNRVRFMD